MVAVVEQQLEAQRRVGVVGDLVSRDGVGQLVDRVEEGVAAQPGEAAVAGPGAGDGLGGRNLLPRVALDGEEADQVGAQVGHGDVPARGVEDGVVQVGHLLAVRVRAGLVEGVCDVAGQGDVAWIPDGETAEGGCVALEFVLVGLSQ